MARDLAASPCTGSGAVLFRQRGVGSEVGEQDAQGVDAPVHAVGVPVAAVDVFRGRPPLAMGGFRP